MGKWRKKARDIIYSAYAEAKSLGVKGRAVRRFINKKFPQYGHSRSKYPYRVWLDELDLLMYREINGVEQLGLNLFGA